MSKTKGTFEISLLNGNGSIKKVFTYEYRENYSPKDYMIDLWIQLFRSCQFKNEQYRHEAASHIKGNPNIRLMFSAGKDDTYISENLRFYRK